MLAQVSTAHLINQSDQREAIQAGFEVPDIILPIGISFFTFQQISLLVDAHKERVQQLRFWDHVLFIAFFPQLIAGPIVRQHDMLPQLTARRDWRLRADYVAIGIALFAFGLFKKTAIIDPFVPYLDLVYQAAADGNALGFLDGWVAGIGYGFQIYFDFSTYSATTMPRVGCCSVPRAARATGVSRATVTSRQPWNNYNPVLYQYM